MFRYFAENITFILIKNKILDIENRDVYVYGIEAVLLNLILLLSLLGISIASKCLTFFIGFLLFFVPIRTFAGGYHAKHSETCFAMSVSVYTVGMIFFKCIPNLYRNVGAIILFALAIIILLIWSPLINANHPLADYQYKRNKRIAYGIIIIYIILFVIFVEKKYVIASSEIIFIVLVSVFLIVGKFQKQASESA